MTNDDLSLFSVRELSSIEIIDLNEVLDSIVLIMAKAYPAYFWSYEQFNVVLEYTDRFNNIFLIGRNVCTATTMPIIRC